LPCREVGFAVVSHIKNNEEKILDMMCSLWNLVHLVGAESMDI